MKKFRPLKLEKQQTWAWDTGIGELGVESAKVAVTKETVKQPLVLEVVVKGHVMNEMTLIELLA